MNPGGRPHSQTRTRLAEVVRAGVVGTWDVLAMHAGVAPDHRVMHALTKLCRSGAVVVRGVQPRGRGRGRLPAVYGAPDHVLGSAVDPLSFARQVWR